MAQLTIAPASISRPNTGARHAPCWQIVCGLIGVNLAEIREMKLRRICRAALRALISTNPAIVPLTLGEHSWNTIAS